MAASIQADRVILPETWLDDSKDFDPYAAFDEATGSGDVDPYPIYKSLRDQGGVIRHAPFDQVAAALAGADEEKPSSFTVWKQGDPEGPVSYGLYSYKVVTESLRNGDVFSSKGYENLMGLIFGHSILEMDHPEHTQHRSLVTQAFRPKVLELWEKGLVRRVIQEQIDSFKANGEADLTKEFTLDYPVQVIAGMLGVPLDHSDWFRRRAIEEISIQVDIERGVEAARVLKEYFSQIIAIRREEPGDDLISELVQAELDGHTLSDEEILPFLMLLSPAGAETTYRSTGNLLYGLLTHPEQLAAVMADRELVPAAVEEAIRWETPLTAIQRWTSREVDVEGVTIPAGSEITMCVASANRDQAVWGEDADEFNVFRPRHQHVAFATGRHTCLGIHLARLEMKVALNMLLDQLPDIHLDPAYADKCFIDGQRFRSPNQLRVKFTPVK